MTLFIADKFNYFSLAILKIFRANSSKYFFYDLLENFTLFYDHQKKKRVSYEINLTPTTEPSLNETFIIFAEFMVQDDAQSV